MTLPYALDGWNRTHIARLWWTWGPRIVCLFLLLTIPARNLFITGNPELQEKPSELYGGEKLRVPLEVGDQKLRKPLAKACDGLPKPRFYEPHEHPLTAIASYPGSGNSWVRGLLAVSSGINTGNCYFDRYYRDVPGYTFKKDDTVIAVKTHHPVFYPYRPQPIVSHDTQGNWSRAVIIIRHPLDALVSYWNFRLTNGSHTEMAPHSSYFTTEGRRAFAWSNFADKQIKHWLRWLTYWVTVFPHPVHITFYESMRDDPSTQLRRMHHFLKAGTPDPTRLACAPRGNSTKLYHRKRAVDKRTVYSEKNVLEATRVIAEMRRLLRECPREHCIGTLVKVPLMYRKTATIERFTIP